MDRKTIKQALRQQQYNAQNLVSFQETRRHLDEVTTGMYPGTFTAEEGKIITDFRRWLIKRENLLEDALNNPSILDTQE